MIGSAVLGLSLLFGTPAPELTIDSRALEEAFAAVDLSAFPTAPAGGSWPESWDEASWSGPSPWNQWAAAVLAGRGGDGDGARAELAVLAHRQNRDADAWSHLAAIADPDRLRAALPHLLPGVPPVLGATATPDDGLPRPDGLAAPLPDGVTLRPALPPPLGEDVDHMVRQDRSVKLSGIRVGAGVISLEVILRGDGVEVEAALVGGEACTVSIVIPEPEDFEIRVEYVDFMRQPEVGVPYELELAPGAEPRRLWGRFLRHPRPWPSVVPEQAPDLLELGGLEVVVRPAALDASFYSELAQAFEIVLGVPARLAADDGGPRPVEGHAPLRFHLTQPEELRTKVAALMGSAEFHALGGRRAFR